MADDKKLPVRRDDADQSDTTCSDNFDALVGDARSALDALTGISGSLAAQLAALERRDREVKNELARCAEESSRLADARDTLKSERADIDKNIAALEERAVELEEFEIVLAKKTSDLEQKRTETDASIEKARSEKAAILDERKSLEKMRAEFESDYGSAADLARKFEEREKELAARQAAADQRDAEFEERERALANATEQFKLELECSTQELEEARTTVEQQVAKNLAREETLRLREESVNQFRDMLTLMRKGIDDPRGDIGEALAKATAAEEAAITASQAMQSDSPLSGFSQDEIDAARKELDNPDATDQEIALRLHARRTMRSSNSPKWRLPWTK